MSRRAARKDANHAIIAQALEAAGCTVFDTSMVGPNGIPGFPDILVLLPDGRLWLCEIKMPDGKFTPDEQSFVMWFVNDNYRVFTSPEQAAKAVRDE